MSIELINRITLKKDGIYVSTHSNNDTSPYHSVKIDYLTKAYINGGIKGLDKEIIDMCFEFCVLTGKHESVLPYRQAINRAINNNEFIEILKETHRLEDKKFEIANEMGDYKNLTKKQSKKLYDEVALKVKELKYKRNEFVAKLVQEERKSIFKNNKIKKEPKELRRGIYEVIPIHKINEQYGEIYDEYMNLNSNNGTIIYEKRLGNLLPSPEQISIREYLDMIERSGVDNIEGANKFIEFIMKYPHIYQKALDNELNERLEKEIEEDFQEVQA